MFTTPLSRSPRVVHSRLGDGEAVLLHLETAQYHELNPIGALIWEMIDGVRTVDEIEAELRTVVDDAPDDLGEIVGGFLEGLRTRGLIG